MTFLCGVEPVGSHGEMPMRPGEQRLTSFLSNKETKVQLVRKCKDCDTIGTIKMQPEHGFSLTQNNINHQRAAPLITFLCNGVEPVGFIVSGLWEGDTAEGTPFKDIDLKNGTFGYRAKDREPSVRIPDLEFNFRVICRQGWLG